VTVHQVFVYGELAKKSTLLQVLGREPLAIRAVLRGYERLLDPDVDYYVAVKKEGGAVEGRLLTGVTEKELLALDEFEGIAESLYDRAMVEVEVEGGKALAHVYVRQL
jgi:gamma-glutamylcyclotransferase (GGCT)/AIG2-like uncharacterized protein YtfP